MNKVLIDTDVILDFFFDRKPFSLNAAIIFSLCESKKIQGFITPVIISNTYYLLRKTASHEKIIDKLKKLLSITEVLLMNQEVVIKAINSDFPDFEDALQHSAAIHHERINAIITRNFKDFKKSKIEVFTPENFIQTIIESYKS